MEHLQRFGLECDPFRNEPQLEFWYASRTHVAAGRRLRRCVEQGKELCVLLGAVGSGTTTVARALFEQLDGDVFELALLVPLRGLDPDGLRAAIARQLGVEAPAGDRTESVRQLFARLVELREQGRRAVVGIDEAHTLGADALAELRALLNLELDDQRLLTVLLVGTPELADVIGRDPGLPGRVELQVTIEPLSTAEACAYLAHRLEVAGGDPALFGAEVQHAIAERASGLPRRLNALADATLFEAHLAERDRPTPEDVERAARDLPWAQPATETVELAEAIEEIETLPPVAVAAAGAAVRAVAETTSAAIDDEPEDALEDAQDDAADDEALAAASFGDAPALESLRDADESSFSSELDLPELEPELNDDLAREVEEALAGDDEPARGGRFALEHTIRDQAIDAALLQPGDTAPGAWRSPEALDDDPESTASRRKPLAAQSPAAKSTPPAAGAAKAANAAQLPPLPDEDELDDLFVDLVEEAEPER